MEGRDRDRRGEGGRLREELDGVPSNGDGRAGGDGSVGNTCYGDRVAMLPALRGYYEARLRRTRSLGRGT